MCPARKDWILHQILQYFPEALADIWLVFMLKEESTNVRVNCDQPVKGLQVGSAEAAQLGPESQAELYCRPLWSNWWAYHVLQEYLGNTTAIQ